MTMGGAGITEPLVRVLSRVRIGTPWTWAAAAAIVGVASVTAGTAPAPAPVTTGRIEGVVTLVTPVGERIPSGAYASRRVSRQLHTASEIRNVVVFVKDAPRSTMLPAMKAEMRQEDEGFVPRLVAITRGSSVEFPNADPFFHNVFSLSPRATFDLGRFPRGESRSRTFTKPGLVKVYCHLHSQMSASIMVFDHELFAIPEPSSAEPAGRFVLADVPAGEHRVSAWHERIGESAKQIVVEAGRTVRVEFALPVKTE